MSTVDHAELYRLEARARADHQTAQQIMGYRYTADTVICDEARDPLKPPTEMSNAYLSGVLDSIAHLYESPQLTPWMCEVVAEAARRLHPNEQDS